MHKKILGTCMALAAFGALAIGPTAASAFNLHLTDTSGGVKTALPVGAKFLAMGETNNITKFTAGTTSLECNETTLTGTVKNNTTVGGNVKGEITFASFDSHLNPSGTDCRSNSPLVPGPVRFTFPALETGGAWCITAGAADTWALNGRKCTEEGTGTITFLLDFTNSGVQCGYQRTAGLAGTFTTTAATHTPATLSVSANQTFTRHVGICPAELSITDMRFQLYTDTVATSTTNYDDAASTADPVWLAE